MSELFEKHFESGWSCWRQTISKDARGGLVKGWVKQFDFEGRLNQGSGSSGGGDVKLINGRETETRLSRVYCSLHDIKAGDRLIFGTDVYAVKSADNVMSFDRLMQIDCEWLKDG